MSKHIMIDIETLGVTPQATILSIACCGFEPVTGNVTEETYYKRIEIDTQENRQIDESTIEWWSKQNAEAQEEAFGEGVDRVDLKDSLEEISKMIWKHENVWTNGTTFDIPILTDAFNEYNIPIPWKFWKVFDTRSVYTLVPDLGKLGNSHNALEDCVNQILLLQKALKALGVTKL